MEIMESIFMDTNFKNIYVLQKLAYLADIFFTHDRV